MEAIDPNAEYKPMDIVKRGFIKNTKGSSGYPAYNFVLKLIKKGLLQAHDTSGFHEGVSRVPHYLVKGENIIKYLNS